MTAERVIALTQQDPPGETTHWTAGMMAEAAGISVSSVQRIWRAHGLQPHRVRQLKLSTDPQFAAKLRDIVGLSRCRRVNSWLASKRLFWALPGGAGDTVVETTVDHTLMRGSEPHDR